MDTNLPAQPAPLARLTIGRIALITALVLAMWALAHVLMLIFFSILVGAALRGAAVWLAARTGLSTTLALAVVVVGLVVLFGGMFYFAGPNLYAQLDDVTHRLVSESDQIRQRLQSAGVMQGGGEQLQALAARAVSPAAQIAAVSLTTVTELFVAIITALYFAASPAVYLGGVVRLVAPPYRARLREVLIAAAHTLRMWVLGQLVSMVAVGVFASLGLWATGVPAPFAIGLISGLLTFVPYIGTIIAGALAVLMALSAGVATAAWALGVFTLCHLFEGYVIAPIVQRRILELPPALSVLAMTVLGSLLGLPGIVLGTPFAASVLVLVQSLYVGDVLGDHTVDPTMSD